MRREALTSTAQELRHKLTEAEKQLWYILRARSMGVKFRRQAVIGRYDEWLKSQGFDVLRFWNNDVLGNLDGVFEVLEARLNSPPPTLPTQKTRGRESQVKQAI